MTPLSIVLAVLLAVSMIATAGVLAVGMSGFFRGGAFNDKYGNTLMQARVVLQAVSIALFFLLMLSLQGSR